MIGVGGSYRKGLVQLHDTGLVKRMTELSGDPSALVPENLDVASPMVPIIDLGRYQYRSYLVYEDNFGGAASGTAILLQDTTQLVEARSWQLQSVSWEDNFSGTSWEGWVELLANINLGNGTSFQKCLMAYYATLGGPARDVQIVVDDKLMDLSVWDKPITHDGSLTPSADVETATVDSLLWNWERLGGAGTPDFTDIAVHFRLGY